jgi:hypothetical protein
MVPVAVSAKGLICSHMQVIEIDEIINTKGQQDPFNITNSDKELQAWQQPGNLAGIYTTQDLVRSKKRTTYIHIGSFYSFKII